MAIYGNYFLQGADNSLLTLEENFNYESNNFNKIMESCSVLIESEIVMEFSMSNIKDKIKKLWTSFKDFIKGIWEKITQLLSNIKAKISKKEENSNNTVSKNKEEKVSFNEKKQYVRFEFDNESSFYKVPDYISNNYDDLVFTPLASGSINVMGRRFNEVLYSMKDKEDSIKEEKENFIKEYDKDTKYEEFIEEDTEKSIKDYYKKTKDNLKNSIDKMNKLKKEYVDKSIFEMGKFIDQLVELSSNPETGATLSQILSYVSKDFTTLKDVNKKCLEYTSLCAKIAAKCE